MNIVLAKCIVMFVYSCYKTVFAFGYTDELLDVLTPLQNMLYFRCDGRKGWYLHQCGHEGIKN